MARAVGVAAHGPVPRGASRLGLAGRVSSEHPQFANTLQIPRKLLAQPFGLVQLLLNLCFVLTDAVLDAANALEMLAGHRATRPFRIRRGLLEVALSRAPDCCVTC